MSVNETLSNSPEEQLFQTLLSLGCSWPRAIVVILGAFIFFGDEDILTTEFFLPPALQVAVLLVSSKQRTQFSYVYPSLASEKCGFCPLFLFTGFFVADA